MRERVHTLRTSDNLDGEAFDTLYGDILAEFDETDDSDTDNSIGNLVLLDSRTNRSYKNAVFPMKRKRVIGLDREGTFVPLCTKNVFMKCYSKKSGNILFWGEEDRGDYRDALIETLVAFLCLEKGGCP